MSSFWTLGLCPRAETTVSSWFTYPPPVGIQSALTGNMSGHATSLKGFVTRFQSASESLEHSYRELKGRVQSLTAEPEREREERIRLERLAAMGEMAMELPHEIRIPLETSNLTLRSTGCCAGTANGFR